MKTTNLPAVLSVLSVLLLTGCAAVTFTKEIEIQHGNRIERETVTTRGYTFHAIQPENIDYSRDNSDTVKIHY